MRVRVLTCVLLVLLAVTGLVWIVALGTSDITVAVKGVPALRCDSVVHPPDLSVEDGKYRLYDALRRSDRLGDGTDDTDVAELVDACGRVRSERVWTSALLAVPTALLFGLAGVSVRGLVQTLRRRPRKPAVPRANEQPRL